MVFLLLVGVVTYGHHMTDSRCVSISASNLPASTHTFVFPTFFYSDPALPRITPSAGLPGRTPAPIKLNAFQEIIRDRNKKVLHFSKISFSAFPVKKRLTHFSDQSINAVALSFPCFPKTLINVFSFLLVLLFFGICWIIRTAPCLDLLSRLEENEKSANKKIDK